MIDTKLNIAIALAKKINLNPKKVMSDFESTSHIAIIFNFLNVQTNGCGSISDRRLIVIGINAKASSKLKNFRFRSFEYCFFNPIFIACLLIACLKWNQQPFVSTLRK